MLTRKVAQAMREGAGQLYRCTFRPSRVVLRGVRIELHNWWATPAICRAIYEGWYERPERNIVEATLNTGDHYLEVGGGIGYVATCACRRVGAENVTVYEANPDLVPVIRRTAELNGFAPVVVNAVLGDHDGDATFKVASDFWESSLSVEDAKAVTVPMCSFRRVLETARPSYLMVDIEGGEIDLLDTTLPAYVRAICVETHPQFTGEIPIQRLLKRLIDQGFALDLQHVQESVAFFAREASPTDVDESD